MLVVFCQEEAHEGKKTRGKCYSQTTGPGEHRWKSIVAGNCLLQSGMPARVLERLSIKFEVLYGSMQDRKRKIRERGQFSAARGVQELCEIGACKIETTATSVWSSGCQEDALNSKISMSRPKIIRATSTFHCISASNSSLAESWQNADVFKYDEKQQESAIILNQQAHHKPVAKSKTIQ